MAKKRIMAVAGLSLRQLSVSRHAAWRPQVFTTEEPESCKARQANKINEHQISETDEMNEQPFVLPIQPAHAKGRGASWKARPSGLNTSPLDQ
jgi:hypothetical protein